MKAVWLERCFYIHGASSPACGKFLKLMQRPLRQFVTTAWKSSLYRTGGAPRTYALRCRFAGLHKWLPSVLQTAPICDAAKKIPKCPADYFHKDAKHTKSFLQLAITVDLIKWPDTGQEDSCCAGSVWGDRNPHLCLLLNCMKLHRLSAVLYTSHLNETNECYSLPPYRYRLRLSRSHLNSF